MRGVILVLLFGTTAALAQPNIPNASFEAWTLYAGSGSFKDYEEPNDGWSSGNGAIHVAANADPVLEKTTDAHSGSFAAKLITRRIFGQVASGSMYTGSFFLNLADPKSSAKQGIPFAARPARFLGWYKYTPVDGDSAVLRATFSRWSGTERQQIGEAKLTIYSGVAAWTQLNLSVVWTTEETPDTVAVVFASSAGGEFFRGGIGSTLWVDDVAFSYEPVSVNEQVNSQTLVVWHSNASELEVLGTAIGQAVVVYDVRGVEVYRSASAAQRIALGHLLRGPYVVSVGNHTLSILR